jgi:hypothetical protein
VANDGGAACLSHLEIDKPQGLGFHDSAPSAAKTWDAGARRIIILFASQRAQHGSLLADGQTACGSIDISFIRQTIHKRPINGAIQSVGKLAACVLVGRNLR